MPSVERRLGSIALGAVCCVGFVRGGGVSYGPLLVLTERPGSRGFGPVPVSHRGPPHAFGRHTLSYTRIGRSLYHPVPGYRCTVCMCVLRPLEMRAVFAHTYGTNAATLMTCAATLEPRTEAGGGGPRLGGSEGLGPHEAYVGKPHLTQLASKRDTRTPILE